MKSTKYIKSTFLIVTLVTMFVTLSSGTKLTQRTYAYETTCPDYMSPQECLNYLEDQQNAINAEKNNLSNGINAEKNQQLTLNQRISQIANEIAVQENEIHSIEVDIEIKSQEVKILNKDIDATQEKVDTVTQEINKLEASLEKRVGISYKMSYVSPFEMFLQTKDFDGFMRKAKYISNTRDQDKKLLSEMLDKSNELEDEKKVLAEKKAEVQRKRNESETKRGELFSIKQKLDEQKAEQDQLLAQSQQQESVYLAQLSTLKEQENSVSSQISRIILEQFQSGQIPVNTAVKAGDIIGYQGHTGYSYGSHLHFDMYQDPFANGYLSLSGGRVYDAAGKSPLGSGAYMTQGFHFGLAIDMVGLGGDQSGDKYYVAPGTVCCTGPVAYLGCVSEGWYSMNGEGTAVRAVRDGMVSTVFTDSCGGKAVIVDHGSGQQSLYLHLR